MRKLQAWLEAAAKGDALRGVQVHAATGSRVADRSVRRGAVRPLRAHESRRAVAPLSKHYRSAFDRGVGRSAEGARAAKSAWAARARCECSLFQALPSSATVRVSPSGTKIGS